MNENIDVSRLYARSKEVHSTLARLWRPWCAAEGYRRVAGHACAFARPRDDGRGVVTFGVQISQWGAEWSGNHFTVNAAGAAGRPQDHATGNRILRRLDDEACAVGVAVERRIRERFPIPPPEHVVWADAAQPGEAGRPIREALAKLQTVNEELWRPGHDIWLPYYDVSDVEEWGHFLAARLPKLLIDLENHYASA